MSNTYPVLSTLFRRVKGRGNSRSFRRDFPKGVDPPGQLNLIHTELIIIPAGYARLRGCTYRA